MKDLYIAAHEELIEEYLNDHPDVSWGEAYKITADAAYERYQDKWFDMVDAARTRAKDERC